MGCDSHLSIETLQPFINSLRWETYALDVPQDRDYDVFEAMAGVRSKDKTKEPIFPPRGIPFDASQSVIYWYKRSGEHTPSWLYPFEFAKAMDSIDRDDLGKEWHALEAILTSLAKIYGDRNVRLVFFFDS
jgi:hypothetical protein